MIIIISSLHLIKSSEIQLIKKVQRNTKILISRKKFNGV